MTIGVARAIKVTLFTALAMIALAILLLASLFVFSSFDHEDQFFLRDAELQNRDYLAKFNPGLPTSPDEEQLTIYAHRVREGVGSIFAYRHFSSGSTNIDDETYRKITIWLASAPPANAVDLRLGDSTTALAVFSNGGSAWPRSGCAGYISRGRIRIEPDGSSYRISIDGEADPIATIRTRDCATERIILSFTASELSYDELTPWLGKHGQHPYEETYR